MSNQSEKVFTHIDRETGSTMGNTTVKQLADGAWEATSPIGSIFGSEVEGECRGVGPTKEIALENLSKDRAKLHESLWY